MTVLQDLSHEQLLAKLAEQQAQIEALKTAQQAKLRCKVSEKGAVSVYGMGQWPVTLYATQWARLFGAKELIEAFIVANKDGLSYK